MSRITSAHDTSIERYLEYPELRIPLFQRGYVWEKENIDEFWEDLIENGTSFLGSVILKDENYNSDKKTGFLEIVDGQQRTVSLLILLSCIARKLFVLAGSRKQPYEQNASAQAEDIKTRVSKRDRNDFTKVLSYKLNLPSEEDNSAFKKVLDGEDTAAGFKSFVEARHKLDELIDGALSSRKGRKQQIEWLIGVKNAILDIKIIEVLVPTDEDAYMIFEAVNDRGADLGAAELLKNYLFSTIQESQKALVHEEWDHIRKSLSEINRRNLDMTGFLRYYWIGKYEHLSKKALYAGIKERMRAKNLQERVSPERIFSELTDFRVAIERIFADQLDDWRGYFPDGRSEQRRAHEWYSYKTNLFYFPKSIQFLPVYSALIGKLSKIRVTDRPYIELLLAVEKINFLYSYALQEPTNKIDKLLSGIGRDLLGQIEAGNPNEVLSAAQRGINKIESLLAETVRREDVDKFVERLSWKKAADKLIIYFILINLEFELGGYGRNLVREDLSLEHVYPKSIEKRGEIPDWPTPNFDYAKIGHGLGNLTLLPEAGPQANGSAGEEGYQVKKKEYLLPSNFSINRYFEHVEDWNGAEIEARLSYIKDAVWKRWGPKMLVDAHSKGLQPLQLKRSRA